jgi:hypothetical protein
MDYNVPLIPTNWRPIDRPLYPWVRTIEKIMHAIQVPRLSGPTIYISSDYSGAVKHHTFDVISVLYPDMEGLRRWFDQVRRIRARYLADGRRMSYKSLGDRIRRRAIIPFLSAANDIQGVAISLAVNKSISRLCSDDLMFQEASRHLQLSPGWRFAAFERMVRVTHLISVLIGGLSKPEQNRVAAQ